MQQNGHHGRKAWVMAAVDRYEQQLVRFATRLLRDEDAARDVVQHAFLRLCDQQRGEIENRLPQWLFTVCRNKAVDLLRQRQRSLSLESEHYETRIGDCEDPADGFEQRDLGELLLQLVDELPDSQREVLLLWLEGWTGKQIAEITNRSHSTVRVHLHKSLTTLRAHPTVRRLQDDDTSPTRKRGKSVTH